VLADEAVLQYDDDLRNKWVGYADAEGKNVPGYSHLKGIEANDARSSADSYTQESMDGIMGNLDPGVRIKAAHRLKQTQNKYRSRIADHNAKELKVAEEQVRQVGVQEAYKEFEANPQDGWVDIVASAGKSPTEVGRVRLMEQGINFAIGKIYNGTLTSEGGSKQSAQNAAVAFFEKVRNQLPEAAELSASSKLLQQQQAIDASANADRKEAISRQQSVVEYRGSTALTESLRGGIDTIQNIGIYTDQVMRTWPDDMNKAGAVLEGHWEESLRSLMHTGGYELAKTAFNNTVDLSKETGMFMGNEATVSKIQSFIDSTLWTESNNIKREGIVAEKKVIFKGIMGANTPVEINELVAQIGGSDMPAESMSMLYGLANNKNKEITSTYKEEEKRIHNLNHLDLNEAAENGLTPEFYDLVMDMASSESPQITTTQAMQVIEQARRFSTNKADPEYKALKSEISTLVDMTNMYYDIETDSVGFQSMLGEKDLKKITERMAGLNRTPAQMKQLAVQSMLREATKWRARPGNEDRPYSEFMLEFSTQNPGVKRSIMSTIAHRISSSWYDPAALIGQGTPEDTYKQEPSKYETYGDTTTTEAPLNPRGEEIIQRGRGAHSVMVPTTEGKAIQANMSAASRGGSMVVSIEERAIATIPPKYKDKYAGLPTEQLMAMQYIRELLIARDGNQSFDLMSDGQKANKVTEALSDRGFQEWYKSQSNR